MASSDRGEQPRHDVVRRVGRRQGIEGDVELGEALEELEAVVAGFEVLAGGVLLVFTFQGTRTTLGEDLLDAIAETFVHVDLPVC